MVWTPNISEGEEKLMNPFCPNCNVMMRSKKVLVKSGQGNYGLRSVWKCPKCKRRYKQGAEVIHNKPLIKKKLKLSEAIDN